MPQKRSTCDRCHRPLRTCLCAMVETIDCEIELLIWQHPSEQNHPKGTAQLLHLCLPNSRIFCGELATPEALHVNPETCLLLYPATNAPTSKTPDKHATKVKQLLLLDGTWRKSRKLIHLNPWLNTLSRYAIAETQSQYVIRKAESHTQLSSFEAGVVALQQLAPHTAVGSLLHVFAQFMFQYKQFLPKPNA